MSIINSYRESKEIVRVSDNAKKYFEEFTTVIVTFQSKVLSELLSKKLVVPIENVLIGTSHSKSPIYRLTMIPKTIFFLSPIGAPTTVALIEEITFMFGIKNIVLYGSAGVLDKEITAGKIIVPSKEYRDEGTSYHYQASSDFIDINNHQIVTKILEDINIDHITGYTWTTDAFYRETEEIFLERKNAGCIVVEMEISAVQAFCNLRKINLYPFVYGADNLDSSKWDVRILGNLDIDSRVNFFLIATQISKYLIK